MFAESKWEHYNLYAAGSSAVEGMLIGFAWFIGIIILVTTRYHKFKRFDPLYSELVIFSLLVYFSTILYSRASNQNTIITFLALICPICLFYFANGFQALLSSYVLSTKDSSNLPLLFLLRFPTLIFLPHSRSFYYERQLHIPISQSGNFIVFVDQLDILEFHRKV